MIAFVPARGGSKSIPKKNIKELGGKPLIVWTIETAFKCCDRVVVNTDDEEIAKVAQEAGAEVMMRPPELAGDTTSMYEVLKSEVPKLDTDLILLLQPTSPLRKVEEVKEVINLFTNCLDKYDSVISVERVPEKYNPAQVIVETPTGFKMADGNPISNRITRRQDHLAAVTPTGSVYIFKTANLEKGSFYGDRVMVLETEPSININTLEDWEEAEKLCQNGK